MANIIRMVRSMARRVATRAIVDDRGDLVQSLAWAAVSVVAIVAIGAVLQQFGVNVVNWAQSQLGIG